MAVDSQGEVMPDSDLHIPLKEYVDTRLAAQEKIFETKIEAYEKALKLALDARDKALDLSRDNLAVRLETMNHIRGQLAEQASTFLTTKVFQVYVEKIELQINLLMAAMHRTEGKASVSSVYIAWVIGVVAILINLLK